MKVRKYPAWLVDNLIIRGAEGEPQGSEEGESTDNPTGDGGSSEEASKSSQDNTHDDADDPKVKGLKTALESERAANAAKEKELKELRKLKKAQDERELAEKTEVEQATIREQKATEKAEKLAQGFLNKELESAIKEAARAAHFIDVEDALAGVDRSALVYTQDEDDPSDVTIDLKTITAAVKAVASKKPHFIKVGTDDGEPSGSAFGGKKQTKKSSEDELRELYHGL